MKVAVVHHSLNSCGGGERLCLSVIEALQARGHEVVLATTERTDWDLVERAFHKRVQPDEEVSLLPIKLGAFGIYQRQWTSLWAYRLRKRCQLVINTHGDVLPVPCDVTYMHYPVFALLEEKPEVYVKYRSSLFWRFYFAPYQLTQARLLRRYLRCSLILTNSTYSLEAIKRQTGRNAIIVYPPVDLKAFEMPVSRPREDVVVTCARLTPEKRLHLVPIIASKCPGAKFYIIGSTSKASRDVLKAIKENMAKYGADNVEVIPDAPLNEVLAIYRKAKVYLHTMAGEHFGIAVVEAMAAGLVPVVHASGGPWLDIVERERYGLGYRTCAEAARHINRLLDDNELFRSLSDRAQRRARDFSEEKFKREFILTLEAYFGL